MARRPRRIAWYVSKEFAGLTDAVREYARHRGLSLSAAVWELAEAGLRLRRVDGDP